MKLEEVKDLIENDKNTVTDLKSLNDLKVK